MKGTIIFESLCYLSTVQVIFFSFAKGCHGGNLLLSLPPSPLFLYWSDQGGGLRIVHINLTFFFKKIKQNSNNTCLYHFFNVSISLGYRCCAAANQTAREFVSFFLYFFFYENERRDKLRLPRSALESKKVLARPIQF